MTTPALKLERGAVSYGGPPVVQAFDLDLAPGESHVLLGRSGSGKTTLLRALAGFERLSQGRLEIGGRLVAEGALQLPPEKRRVGLVFQDYALFPHLDALGNVRFGMRSGGPEAGRALLQEAGLGALVHRRPAALSGGEQQRVAVMRALAADPAVMLLDEPFSNLDRALRQGLRSFTRRLLAERGTPAIYVTHDAEEAFDLADRVSVLVGGRLAARGTPEQLYLEPPSAAVARLVGDCALLPLAAEACTVGRVSLTCRWGAVRLRRPCGPQDRVMLVRPEQWELGEHGVPVRILDQRFAGPWREIEVEAEGARLLLRQRFAMPIPSEPRLQLRAPVVLVPSEEHAG